MGLLNKSDLYTKQFSASDPAIRAAMQKLFARKDISLLENIHIQMNTDVYNELLKRGYINRRKSDR